MRRSSLPCTRAIPSLAARSLASVVLGSKKLSLLLLVAWISAGASGRASAEDLGMSVPPGFEINLYAGDDLAHNIFALTVDAKGRVVVAGPGYVKILHDDNQDGKADRATDYATFPGSGAHGMYFDGPDLILTGDNGLWKIRDTNGDDVADGPREKWAPLRHPEHGANGIVKGPDGWIYVICGNDAGVTDAQVRTLGSPVRQPKCGTVVRFAPDGSTSEVFAHGFRNPYDLTINGNGQLFTVDSDGERDHHLPWYAPNRLFDIAQGQEHGWLLAGWQRSWNRPAWFFDNVERVIEVGRGSPTGLCTYQHTKFPEHYRQGVFSLCWTFGRVYFHALQRQGSSYQGKLETFLQTTGNVGFAPVDMEVGADGALYIAIGGRSTRGSVFRVSYTGDQPAVPAREERPSVLSAPQPLSSWSRAKWVPRAKELGRDVFDHWVLDPHYTLAERIRAVEIVTEVFGGLTPNMAGALAHHEPELAARAAWSLGHGPDTPESRKGLIGFTRHPDPFVRRAAWEAIAARPQPWTATESPDWDRVWLTSDRRLRWASLLAAARVARASYDVASAKMQASTATLEQRDRAQLNQAWLQELAQPHSLNPRRGWELFHQLGLPALEQSPPDIDLALETLRVWELSLGDVRTQEGLAEVYSGYAGNKTDDLDAELRRLGGDDLARVFPTANPAVDLELARLASLLQPDGTALLPKLATRWTSTSPPDIDLHYLIVASRLPGPRTADVTRQTAATLAQLHRKMNDRKWYPSRNWPERVGEIVKSLLKLDPALGAALLADPNFGAVEHSLYAELLTGELRKQAAEKLLIAAEARADEDEPAWTAELIRVASELPAERVLPIFRANWSDPGLQDTIALVLAKQRQPVDRGRLNEALQSMQPEVVTAAADALKTLAGPGSPEELTSSLKSLKRWTQIKEAKLVHKSLTALLEHWSGQSFPQNMDQVNDAFRGYGAWFTWFAEAHPQASASLSGLNSPQAAVWKARLPKVDWASGNADRGKLVFEKKSCQRCHAGPSRLGPGLDGAAARFSREDLFAAIIDPNRDIAPLYRSLMIVTKDGRIHVGLQVYESPDGTLLQTSPEQTVRITGDEVQSRYPASQSLMPSGLLDGLSDQDLADLDAFLRTLKPR